MSEPQGKKTSALSEYKASVELMSKFIEHAEIVVCPRDHVLFRIGEPATSVYLVRSGEVELRLPLSKGSGLGFYADSGLLVGLPAAFRNEPYSMTAVASADSELAVMEREEFCQLLQSNSALSFDVLRILAGETHAVRALICELE